MPLAARSSSSVLSVTYISWSSTITLTSRFPCPRTEKCRGAASRCMYILPFKHCTSYFRATNPAFAASIARLWPEMRVWPDVTDIPRSND